MAPNHSLESQMAANQALEPEIAPWDPRGDPRAPSAPFGGMGPGGPLGLFRSHSEWKAISNGKQLRMEGHSEIKAIS